MIRYKKNRHKLITFVLPQFHPIPENDKWWGKGFTEWTNVTKAKPLFKGHYQPQLPTDLGFYDLRLPEARTAQAKLAKKYGIYGFCYYHYWFNGKRLLDKPIDGILEQKDLDMPFMLCWANENWTRRWDGMEKNVLIAQEYSQEDDKRHIRWLCENVFTDERYIKVNGRPVFLIYRQDLFPDIIKTATLWRKIAREEYGFEDLYLCITEGAKVIRDPEEINFDAAVEFSPHQLHECLIPKTPREKFKEKYHLKPFRTHSFLDYDLAIEKSLQRENPGYKLFRSVTPSWDNTARLGKWGVIAKDSSPEKYKYWLEKILQGFDPYSTEENFVFINALNEWAEGNKLEPCIKYGTAYYEATREALENSN